jgi:hypothetical protein
MSDGQRCGNSVDEIGEDVLGEDEGFQEIPETHSV